MTAITRDLPELAGETINIAIRSDHSLVIRFNNGVSLSVATFGTAPLVIERRAMDGAAWVPIAPPAWDGK